MSILITGIEMPDEYAVVVIHKDGTVRKYYDCVETVGAVIGNAVPVPPHGDLIDLDKFHETMFIGEQCLYSWDEIEDAIDYAPTIIPAEPPKEEA